jgi:hypothetical protein
VVHANHYLEDFFDGDRTRALSEHDMRETDSSADKGSAIWVDRYIRDELAYAIGHSGDAIAIRWG